MRDGPPNPIPPAPKRTGKIRKIDLDQARGLVHYPYNCGRCMSEDICRGQVTGTYMCNCDSIDLPYPGSTVRVNGRTYPIGAFVEMITPSLPEEDA
jgi:hypothetical protein